MRIYVMVLVLVIALVTNGCAESYRYTTGRKAERESKELYEALNSLEKKGQISFDKGKMKIPVSDDKLLNEDEGVEYSFKKGEKKQSIIKKLGEPIKINNSNDKTYDEIWEYDFCSIHFKKGRLSKLYFKNEDGDPEDFLEEMELELKEKRENKK
ncbi:MAG: hypothetical protein ABII88_06810 [Candidatus Omnitrophota bacterium]